MGLLGILRAGSQFHVAILAVVKRALDVDADVQVGSLRVIGAAAHDGDGIAGFRIRGVDATPIDLVVSLGEYAAATPRNELVAPPGIDRGFLPLQVLFPSRRTSTRSLASGPNASQQYSGFDGTSR